MNIKEIKQLYLQLEDKIIHRLEGFKNLWKTKDDVELFAELCFCLLTPQSRARHCWMAVLKLKERKLLLGGNTKQIQSCLSGVRFKNKKAEYIIKARRILQRIRKALNEHRSIGELRTWCIKNICGLGYKEASHFLRNIGLGENLAILDRHILKNLKALGVIEKIPRSLTRKNYIEIEDKLRLFSLRVGIPVSHLDLLLWSKETGEIFK